MTQDITRTIAHRPWPLPRRRWIMFQSWQNQLFAHWRIAPDRLRSRVPAGLELDLHDGAAWLGITPFLITGQRFRGLPVLPIAAGFPEVNLRTYVTVAGRRGVFFFSLDAASRLAVMGGRAGFGLPYRHATMSIEVASDGWTRFHSRRSKDGAELLVRYRSAAGRLLDAAPGTLQHFLTERYALYVVRRGRVLRGDIHHRPWELRSTAAVFERNTLASSMGIRMPDDEPLLHYSQRQDALIWAPVAA